MGYGTQFLNKDLFELIIFHRLVKICRKLLFTILQNIGYSV